MHSVSVAGVVQKDDGRVLCIRRRDTGTWQIPGGVLETDERIEDGLRREVLEETGASVEVVRLSGIYQNLPLGVVALVFLCRPVTDTVAASTAEAVETAWLTVDEVRERSVPAFAVRVLDAVRAAAADDGVLEVPVRAHDGERLVPPRVRLDARSTVPGPE